MKQDRDLMGVRGARLLLTLFVLTVLVRCGRGETRANTAPPPIEIKATVQPAQSMTITAQIEGEVESVVVKEGATVAADAPLVTLFNPAVERDAATTRAQLQWIETRLRRSGRPAAAAPAQGRPRDSIEIAARILALRKQRLDKMKELRGTNDITARELEVAEIEYLAALRDYNNERRVFPGAPAAAPDDRELLRIEREKTVAEEKFASQRQSLLRINSPIAGTVTRVHVAQGQGVYPRDPVAEVSNLSTLHVRGTIAPELLRYVRPGMRVDIRILSIPPRTFADEIEYVLPVTGSESRMATVIAAIPNPDGSLQPNTEAVITLRGLR